MRFSLPQAVVVAASLLVAAGCARLGFWQLDRLDQRREYNAAVAAVMDTAPLDLDAFSDSVLRDPEAFLYRPAIAEGTPDWDASVLLRGRTETGRPGVHLVDPVRLDNGHYLLVNRGWISAPDGATADPRPWLSGDFEMRGLLQRVPATDVEAQPLLVEPGDTTVQTYRRLDLALFAEALPGPLLPLYLEVAPQAAPEGGLPIPVALATLDEGPHFGYAVQWFSFGLIALLGPPIFAVVRRGSAAAKDPS